MSNISIIVTNRYLPNITEIYIHPHVDISDFDEVDYCAEEACGKFLNEYRDVLFATCPDLDWETIAEACEYLIQEVDI